MTRERTPEAGHNSGVTGAELRSICERVEKLTEEKKDLQEDIKQVLSEAKGKGFDLKVLRAIIKLRAQDAAERQEFEAALDIYKSALGLH